MIYLNNAATSYPKPPSVVQAMTEALEHAPKSALRSNLTDSDDVLSGLRQQLGRLFHINDWNRIFFCSSATDAINRVLGGLRLSTIEVSRDNHNSVLRPLMNDTRPRTSHFALTIVPHCSNVTGEIHNIKRVCQEAHAQGRIVMVDAAQSAGSIPIDVDGWGVDILVFTGHKALFGPTGTGGYYVRRGIDLRPTQFGGTGRDSSIIRYEEGDWEYEVGTQNLVGLTGLSAGVAYVLQRGVENIYHHLLEETLWLIKALKSIKGVRVYERCDSKGVNTLSLEEESDDEHRGSVVSFNIEGLKPSDVGYILQNSYNITVRTGLHCAPLIHEDLGTAPLGTVRASLSCFNTRADIETLVDAVSNITSSL